ncbi:hypothetical protein Tco_0072125 [Tanacetum coccineum]
MSWEREGVPKKQRRPNVLTAKKLNLRSSRLIIMWLKCLFSDFKGYKVSQEALCHTPKWGLNGIRVRGRTDKSKITRKQSKASKHGHENQKSAKPKPQKTKALANFHLQGPILLSSKVLYNLKRGNEREGPNVLTFQTSTVLTVEKGAGTTFTVHPCLRCPQFDPMGYAIDDQMIEEMRWQRLKDWSAKARGLEDSAWHYK